MSSIVWLAVLIVTLTALGGAALYLVTVKYYWGARGRPPLAGDERRNQKRSELEMRKKQIANSEQNPIKERSQSFLNNRKL